ncbi:hypothetical protein [Actinomadura sp. NPDC048394]|uniref:hypothetical protein n=1 Tax=Actinomadura sp. NPDC048394 TaxID=3158223 RepID=UPI0033E8A016
MIPTPLLRRICLVGLVTPALACVPLAAAEATPVPSPTSTPAASATSVVGFWAGEVTSAPQGSQSDDSTAYYDPADRSALTSAVWDVLKKNHVPLYLNMRYGRDFGPVPAGVHSDAASLVRKANGLGVPVIAWIVVPSDKGYWAYEGNAPTMTDAVKAWASWKNAERLRFASVALDQEFSSQNLRTYTTDLTGGKLGELAVWMNGNIDPAKQCKALRDYRDLISWAHDRGIAVTAAEAPMVVDDLHDGNLALQDALDIAGSSPGYDQTYLMAYRSGVAESGVDPGSAYVSSYYTDMQKYFGKGGQASLGVGGQKPYDTLTPLVDDVRMLAGLGARQIPIYSLESTVGKFGAAGLQTIVEAASHPMKGSELTEATKPTALSEGFRVPNYLLDATATALTFTATAKQGHLQGPNSWPNGCGDLAARPLAHHQSADGQ